VELINSGSSTVQALGDDSGRTQSSSIGRSMGRRYISATVIKIVGILARSLSCS